MTVEYEASWSVFAPGIAPPGPDFVAAAVREVVPTPEAPAPTPGPDGEPPKPKRAKKPPAPGLETPGVADRIEMLYERALRVAGFRLRVQAGPGRTEEVEFVVGHLWGEATAVTADSGLDDPPQVEETAADGPRPADVMILGKMPWKEEVQQLRNLVGPSGGTLRGALASAHIDRIEDIYVTNLVKFKPPGSSTNLLQGWIKDCLPILHVELRLVRPRILVCCGADAAKAVLGKQASVTGYDGRVTELTIDCRKHANDPPDDHTILVMVVLHPAEVLRDNTKKRTFDRSIGRLARLIGGSRFDLVEAGDDLDHRVLSTKEEAEAWLQEAEDELLQQQPIDRMVAWDGEWHGQHPINAGAYLRTIQASHRPKAAGIFRLTEPGGKPSFVDASGRPAVEWLYRRLNAFAAKARPVGHFLVSDLEWFHHVGFDPVRHWEFPLDPDDEGRPPWWLLRAGRGWFDTALMLHAIEETAMLGLDEVSTRFTDAPRYSVALDEWKKEFCRKHKMKVGHLEGYGDCPDEVLIGRPIGGGRVENSYAGYDADVTVRIARELRPLLDSDYNGQCAWESFWSQMIVTDPILAMHKRGVKLDRHRVDVVTMKFLNARSGIEQKLREEYNWPDFNPRSLIEVREVLFGEKLNGSVNKETGEPERVRPGGAVSLYLTPSLSTHKPPKTWDEVVEKGLEKESTPGTGKAALGLLMADNPDALAEIKLVRDHRYIDQVLKSVFRPPNEMEAEPEPEPPPEPPPEPEPEPEADEAAEPEAAPAGEASDDTPAAIRRRKEKLRKKKKTRGGGGFVIDGDGYLEYDAGLAAAVDDDGRVRTHFYTTADSKRWKSSRPPLQNLSASRDGDYKELLGDQYKEKVRSVLMAEDGYLLVDADIKGAELFVAAVLSGDPNMYDHVIRSNLAEKGYDAAGNKVAGGKFPHPNFYDIHSNVAKLAFRLECDPTKRGLEYCYATVAPADGVVDKVVRTTDGWLIKMVGGAVLPTVRGEKPFVSEGSVVKQGEILAGGRAKFRILAKAVIFGLMYGRGAKAIAVQARMEGVPGITVQVAEEIIQAVYTMYPCLEPFFAECRRRVVDPGFLVNPFGGMRRFPAGKADRTQLADFERQAMNWPMQSTVAEVIDRAIARLYRTIRDQGLEDVIRLVLQVHDSIVLETRYDYVKYVRDELIPYAMKQSVPIYPTDLGGNPLGTGPFYMETDTKVGFRWSESLSEKEIDELAATELAR